MFAVENILMGPSLDLPQLPVYIIVAMQIQGALEAI